MKSNARWHAALAVFLWIIAPCPAGAQAPDVIISEVLVDPASDLTGDANGDGVRDTYEDEFIEIVNRGSLPADVSGWMMGPPGGLSSLPSGTLLAPGEYLVLFGGGTPTGLPGWSLTADGRLGSGLSNTAGRLLLIDPAGPDTLQDITYSGWDTDASWVRSPEGWGDFVDHGLVSGAAFSPSGPSLPAGGPDQSGPALYRVRVANLTASGFSVAWRTPWATAGRLELLPDGGPPQHRYDPGPASRLHRVDYYGLAPAADVEWRAVSGGNAAPSDSLFHTVTAEPGTSVPYTVYGELIEQAGGAPVTGGHVFLRSLGSGLPSGWLLAVSDSSGSWSANLGNLRAADGGPFAWAAGDTLEVEADGQGAEVTSARRVVSGSAPQYLPLPPMEPDPAPLFTWTGSLLDTQADTALVLDYALQDAGEAWASLFLHPEDGSDPIAAVTYPTRLHVTPAGTVTLDTSGLPEGSRWQVSAIVEDGRNTPGEVFHPARLRIAHEASRDLPVPAGIRLFTPTLQDPSLAQASDWLDRLPGPGELARWDTLTASWSAAARLADGSRVGEDFPLQAGRGYALVSASAGTVRAVGPRRYAPAAIGARAGLSLLGIADSLAVRAAETIFDDPDVLAVSRWDLWRQQWQGRFRLPDGRIAGDDFLISWGDAVAVTVDSAFSWQPVAPRVVSRPESPVRPHRPATTTTAAALLLEPGPGACSLVWRAPPGARVVLSDAAGLPRWSGTATGLSQWRQATVSGLPGGTYTADLEWETPAGRVRIQRAARIVPAGPPALPTWLWGPVPAGEGTLLLAEAGGLRPVRTDPETGTWYVAGGADAPEALLMLAPDGGWDRWPLVEAGAADGLRGYAPGGASLSVTGLEAAPSGPLAVEARFQVLGGAGPVRIRYFLGYDAAGPGGGPPGDPRHWAPAGEVSTWEPGDLPGRHDEVACPPGPDGQEGPEAVAVRLQTADGGTAWLGPVPVPRAEEAPGLALLPAVPNPFNPVTRIRYRIPEGPPRHVRLEVRDVRGRRVRVLEEGLRGPGLRMVTWEGTDGSGRRAAAGVYLVLLEVDGVRLTRKVLLLK